MKTCLRHTLTCKSVCEPGSCSPCTTSTNIKYLIHPQRIESKPCKLLPKGVEAVRVLAAENPNVHQKPPQVHPSQATKPMPLIPPITNHDAVPPIYPSLHVHRTTCQRRAEPKSIQRACSSKTVKEVIRALIKSLLPWISSSEWILEGF